MIRDALAITGFCSVAVGVWWLSPAWSLIVCGSILLSGGVIGAWRNVTRKDIRD